MRGAAGGEGLLSLLDSGLVCFLAPSVTILEDWCVRISELGLTEDLLCHKHDRAGQSSVSRIGPSRSREGQKRPVLTSTVSNYATPLSTPPLLPSCRLCECDDVKFCVYGNSRVISVIGLWVCCCARTSARRHPHHSRWQDSLKKPAGCNIRVW